jgi:hypothetical protein
VTDSYETLPIWLNVPDHSRRDLGISKLSGIDALNVAIHRTRVDECVMVHNRDAVVHMTIDVGHVRDFVDGVVVVNVRHLDHTYPGVGHVYILNIARTGAIPRNVNLSRGKREPSDWL